MISQHPKSFILSFSDSSSNATIHVCQKMREKRRSALESLSMLACRQAYLQKLQQMLRLELLGMPKILSEDKTSMAKMTEKYRKSDHFYRFSSIHLTIILSSSCWSLLPSHYFSLFSPISQTVGLPEFQFTLRARWWLRFHHSASTRKRVSSGL